MELPKIPRELEEAIKENELIIFVGAGLTYNLLNAKGQPIKGWSNLVHQILQHLKEEGHDVEVLFPLVARYEPIDILHLIERDKNISREKISDFIKDFLDLKEDNNFDLHRKLYRLSKKIITTNYDKAFEKANPELSKNTAFKGKTYELSRHRKQNASLLFKLHGCYEFVDSMILFPSDYSNFYGNRQADYSIVTLRNFILNKSILFIGTGMGDFQINNIFREIKNLQGEYNQKHFIITKNPLDSSLDFLTPLMVSDFAQIEGIVDQLIVIKEQSGSNDTEQVKTLKAQLGASEEKIKELEALNHPNRDKLLEREAWKYFSRGLNFSLEDDSERAAKEYEVAVELNPDLYQAFYNWGNALCKIAMSKSGKPDEKICYEAFEKYEKAINLRPDIYQAFNNWGLNLGKLALSKTGNDAYELFNDAFDKFKESIKIKPKQADIYWAWGTFLGKLASTIEPRTRADKLYHKAFKKYGIAVKINRNLYQVYNNWGIDLGNFAPVQTGKQVERLFYSAFNKFKKSVRIKQDNHEAYKNWGTLLMYLAKLKTGNEAEELLDQALDKLQKSVEYGGDSYNLACLHALRNQKEPALRHLQISLENKQVQANYVVEDEDWALYFQDPDFLALLQRYPS
ncbi:MAG: SIR2 family protein [Saprospiraceae bacterium]|nr:SIR2 family protein [Saprospiraceae bacterium]